LSESARGDGRAAADPVRPAGLGDLDAILELEALCFQDPWSDEALLAELRPHRRRRPLVVEVDGRVRGVALVWHVADELHLVSLGIHPEYRRRGLATRLLHELCRYGRRHAVRLITLEVREHNEGARRFYLRHGFMEVARRRGYYPDTSEDALVLLLPLESDPGPEGSADDTPLNP
jgi:ribosomal-protein-alanine N-acetyltransferase